MPTPSRSRLLRSALALLAALSALPALAAEPGGTLARIRDSGVILLGHRTDSAPFSFVGQEGRPVGYSVELCERVVGHLREAHKLPGLRVQWVPVTSANRIDMVSAGKVDLECGTTSATLSRQERVDFSNLIFVDGAGVLARADRAVKRLSDLAGRRVAVTAGSTTGDVMRQAFKDRSVNVEIVVVRNELEGLSAVESGKVDAYANDRVILLGLLRKLKGGVDFVLVDEDASMEPYALMMRRDPVFRLAVNRALSRIYRSPAIVEVYNAWFGVLGAPGPLLAAMYYLNTTPE
jgi:polar amino acid transport system substrate-binding protein/glutamate/aspartate transport system substrate-binding protein